MIKDPEERKCHLMEIMRDLNISPTDLEKSREDGNEEDIHEIKFKFDVRDWIIHHKEGFHTSATITKYFGSLSMNFGEILKIYPQKTWDFTTSDYVRNCEIDHVPLIIPTIEEEIKEMV